jgi:uncharacterized protein
MLDLFNYNNMPDILNIKVTPKAKIEKIKSELQSDNTLIYKIYVHAEAKDGKANQAVIRLLSEELQIPKTSFQIIRGLTSRNKTIQIMKHT